MVPAHDTYFVAVRLHAEQLALADRARLAREFPAHRRRLGLLDYGPSRWLASIRPWVHT
jgi:hypothetical protein